ncbi:MAG: hypothetical protein IJB41_09010 [Clostridia bacterium]|nr:hypothetical protein [Clostridia bacterium]
MDFSKFTDIELIQMYGELLGEMRAKNIIRSKNVAGDLGEYLVIEHYCTTKGLPKLQIAAPSTKNIDANGANNGERYSIKTITGTSTGAFYGIEKDADENMHPLFEHAVLVKLDDMYQPELILELDWDTFFRHKRWHSRIKAYILTLTKALIEDGKVIYRKKADS